jgi:flagellar biosynthesis/type III secretory pathway ATPase
LDHAIALNAKMTDFLQQAMDSGCAFEPSVYGMAASIRLGDSV